MDRRGQPMVRLRAPPAGGGGGNWPLYRVLLIEDNKWDAELTQQLLLEAGQSGFHMEWAQRLTEGLSRVAKGDIDIVLLDLSLPDSRGLTTVAKLRSEAPQIPLLVLTGLEDESIGTESIKLGAEDYLVKGRYDGQLLVRSMRYAIERNRFQQERRAALEWKKELDHLREVDRLRTMFLGAPDGPGGSLTPPAAEPDGAGLLTPQEKLSELVDQLVNIIQIQEGTASFQRESTDLNLMVREIVESSQTLAEQRRVALECFAEGPLFLEADALRVIQVLRGLIDNAIRHTSPGGRILVETKAQEGHAVVQVRDTGVGMMPEELDAVFRPEVRGRDPSGLVPTGLTMFLAKQLIELQGGRVAAHSDGPQHGSTFSFSLPLRPT